MIEGGCRCGAVRYRLALDWPLACYACHCRDCQTMSGSAFAVQAPVRPEALAVTGALASWCNPSKAGGIAEQFFCATCHTRIYSTNTARPGLAIVRAGTVDESERLEPRLHIWVRRKQPWIALPDGVPAYEENAPVAAFMAILTS